MIKQLFKNKNTIVGLFGFLLGITIYFVIIPKTVTIPSIGRYNDPFISAVDFAPKLWTALLILSSLFLLVLGLFTKKDKGNWNLTKIKEYVPVFIVIIITIIYGVLLNLIGFLFASIPCLAFTIWYFGYRDITKILTFSVVFCYGLLLFFEKILKVTLP